MFTENDAATCGYTTNENHAWSVTAFRLVLRVLIFLIILLTAEITGFCNLSYAETPTSVERENYLVYASSRRHTPEFNKFAYLSQELTKTKSAYQKDKKQFERFMPTGEGPPILYQPGLDEVIHGRAAQLHRALERTDYTIIRVGLSILPVPNWIATAGDAALHFLPEFNDKNPLLARNQQDRAVMEGFDLAHQSGAVADEIKKAGQQWLGASPLADFSDSEPVRNVAAFRLVLAGQELASKKAKLLGDEVKRVREDISKLEQGYAEAAAHSRSLDEEATLETNYQRERGELLGTLELAGYAARALGDKDLQLAFSATTFALDRYSTLAHNSTKLGSVALTAGYVGTTVAVIDMLRTSGEPDPTAAALSQIIAELQVIRGEMNARFDRVDQALNMIWNDVMSELQNLEQTTKENHQAILQEFETVRQRLDRQEKRMIDLAYVLEGSTRRLESALAHVRRSAVKEETNFLLSLPRNTPAWQVEKSLSVLDNFVKNEIGAAPFADALTDFQELSPEKQMAALQAPFDGPTLTGQLDITNGLQALLVGAYDRAGKNAPTATPNVVAWIDLAQEYLEIIRKHGQQYPKFRSSAALKDLVNVGTTIESRLQFIFGQSQDASDHRAAQTVLFLFDEYARLLAASQENIRGQIAVYETAQTKGLKIFGGLQEALEAQKALSLPETGPISRCGGNQSFCDVVQDHFKTRVCKDGAMRDDGSFGPCRKTYCKDMVEGYERYNVRRDPLESVLLNDNVVPPQHLAAYRLGLATFRACYGISVVPASDPAQFYNLTREERARFVKSHTLFEILIRTESSTAGSEFVASPQIATICPQLGCDDGLRETLGFPPTGKLDSEQKFEFQRKYLNYVWTRPGGARQQFGTQRFPDMLLNPGNPAKLDQPIVSWPSASWKQYLKCYGDVPPATQEEQDACFPKINSSHESIDHIKAFFVRYPWQDTPFIRSPLWRIHVQTRSLEASVEMARLERRKDFTERLLSDANGGRLGEVFNKLDVARTMLQAAVMIAFQDSYIYSDNIRELFHGGAPSLVLPNAAELRAVLNKPDDDWRQVERLLTRLERGIPAAKDRITALGGREQLGQFSDLLSELSKLSN